MPPVSHAWPLLVRVIHAANGLAEWLMTYAVHSTLLIGGLLLLTATTPGRRLVTAHGSWFWRFALAGALVTASLQSMRSAAPLSGTLRVDSGTPKRTMVRVELNHETLSTLPTVREAGRMAASTSIDVNPVWPLIALGVWFVVAATLFGRFLLARDRFLRAIGPRRSAGHTIAGNALRHLLRESRINRHVRLTLSDRLTSPVALDDDEICLPARALSELDPIRLESILAHELAHLVRRDPLWLTIARVIETFFFFQPLNILARRRMQESAEFASDAWASLRLSRPIHLAHCLARVAEWTIAAPRLPVPAMAERSGAVLVRRVERLTTGQAIPETAPGRGLRLAAVAALIGLILMAPRAAIGAESPPGRFLDARIRASSGLMMIRNVRDRSIAPDRGDVRAFVYRVTR